MNFKKRGQSALEYLMTYGWALVVIVIAVAALVVLINPSTIQGDQCDAKFGPFTVSQSVVTSGTTQLVLVNQSGQSVSYNTVDVTGTDGGSDAYTSAQVDVSAFSLNANDTNSLTIDQNPNLQSGAYNLTYTINYDAGQLTGLTATGNCRGTI